MTLAIVILGVLLILGPPLIAPFIKKPGRLRSILWKLEGIEEPGPLGVEHAHTASSACSQGRHWNCGIYVYSGVPIPGLMGEKRPCSCPCHAARPTKEDSRG